MLREGFCRGGAFWLPSPRRGGQGEGSVAGEPLPPFGHPPCEGTAWATILPAGPECWFWRPSPRRGGAGGRDHRSRYA